MAKITLIEEEEYPTLPPESIVRVRVNETPEIEELDGKYGPWQKINFEFVITAVPDDLGDYKSLEGSRIWGGIPFKFTESADNQLRQWVEALLGLDNLSAGFELDTDELVGKEARAVIRNFDRKNGGTGHGVDSLLPVTGGPAQMQGSAVGAPAAGWTAPAAQQPTLETVPSTPPPVDDDIPF